jgi:hypothetical protein
VDVAVAIPSACVPPRMAPTLLSAVTLSTLGLFSKTFLNYACRDLRVQGLEHLLRALQEPPDVSNRKGRLSEEGFGEAKEQDAVRPRRRGIVTSMFPLYLNSDVG